MTAPISVQLYTLRHEAERDFADVLARLGKLGFAGVETAGLHDLSPTELRRCVADAGMVVSAAHVPLPTAESAEQILDEQEEIGNRDLVVAFLPPERFADAAGVARVADELNEALERVRARGMGLGYHNHWWEFQHIEGETAHARLFRHLDPEVFAEVDTYWAQVGGVDPAKAVAELGARARMLHLKDGPAEDPKAPMTALGEGALDVPAIALASRAEWHVVELDRCATDVFEAVEKSYCYLTGAGLARGRT
ncbi:MAG: sugar phosphate isomerase/epimerase [Myxococcota bacterium]